MAESQKHYVKWNKSDQRLKLSCSLDEILQKAKLSGQKSD